MTFEDDLLALEARVLNRAAGDFLAAVEEIRRLLASGEPGILRLLNALPTPKVEAAVLAGVMEAFTLGKASALADATSIAAVTAGSLVAASAIVPATVALIAPLAGLDERVRESKRKALALNRAGATAQVATAPVLNAATSIHGLVTSQVNQAANQAVVGVAEKTRQKLVWQAERDACVWCLGLSGQVVGAGEVFPDADRYAPQPKAYGAILEPPRHRNCRCTLAVVVDDSYPIGLQREADRSILRGFSLQSESNSVRVKAAERLLADPDLVAPKSVKEYARRAVRDGKFPRGREVPAGGPRLVVN